MPPGTGPRSGERRDRVTSGTRSDRDATIRTGFQPENLMDRIESGGPAERPERRTGLSEQERQEPRDRTLWLVTVGRVATAVAGVIALIRMLIIR